MATSLPVKWVHSAMQGAPSLANNSFGSMISVLDAVLVTGFNIKSVTSITRSGSLATMNISAGHLYAAESVVRVDNADQDEYNGDKRVISVTANSLTFEVTGSPATPATGTITVRQAPLGFEKAFAGTNKAAYRSLNPLSLKPYLRVDNSQHASWVTGRQVSGRLHTGMGMSDIDTFVGDYAPYDATNSFPNWGWFKWYQAFYSGVGDTGDGGSAGSSDWTIVGDDRCFYFVNFLTHTSYSGGRMYGWGEIESFKPSDPAPVFLWANENYNEVNYVDLFATGPQSGIFSANNGNGALTSGQLLLKSYTGIGGSAQTQKISLGTVNDVKVKSGYITGVTWPNGPDLSMILCPTYVMENAAHLRGIQPGLFCIHNNLGNQVPHRTIVDNVSGYTGRKFIILSVSEKDSNVGQSNCRVAFDITGPWR